MSYKSVVFTVMIASPGDVLAERGIIRDIVYEWNVVHSKSKGIVLLPVGWESHSSPEMGESPQAIINRQVLDKCDLLVGVFWTRIGTATDEYSSGTVEEIERHIKSQKPAMLYFSKKPVEPDSIDQNQYGELKKFKESCRKKGLYQEYENLGGFKDSFYRHLQLKINEHPLFSNASIDSLADTGVLLSNTNVPNLSQEASILLKEAAQDPNGNILCLHVMEGTLIKANGKSFSNNSDRRETAKWESAIQELLTASLIVARGTKGEIFDLTNLGYQIADRSTL